MKTYTIFNYFSGSVAAATSTMFAFPLLLPTSEIFVSRTRKIYQANVFCEPLWTGTITQSPSIKFSLTPNAPQNGAIDLFSTAPANPLFVENCILYDNWSADLITRTGNDVSNEFFSKSYENNGKELYSLEDGTQLYMNWYLINNDPVQVLNYTMAIKILLRWDIL